MIHFLVVTAHLLLFYPSKQSSSIVIVEVKGISVSKGGELSAVLFLEANFPKPRKQLIGTAVRVNAEQMSIVFKDVPPGKYGVVAFQDMDANKDLKKNLLGFTQDPIGFYNDERIQNRPPAFSDAAITVEAGKTITIQIILR
ncbi:DUF2141 domain-containing protein [Sediminibacterium sp.]|uniref:DUF2141 domain-containing protein n=1 Tax=Sediminibacterium sp. TaxID=1917865 RepID=UPI003F72A13A